MKKSLILLPALLFIVFVFLSALDHGDYALEKRIWLIQKSVKKNHISVQINEYKDLIAQYPKSQRLTQIYMNMGELYGLKGDYNAARFYYFKILKQFARPNAITAIALLQIGLTYEREHKEQEAIKTYKQIILENQNPLMIYYAREREREQKRERTRSLRGDRSSAG